MSHKEAQNTLAFGFCDFCAFFWQKKIL